MKPSLKAYGHFRKMIGSRWAAARKTISVVGRQPEVKHRIRVQYFEGWLES
jgi:hypothetical protein